MKACFLINIFIAQPFRRNEDLLRCFSRFFFKLKKNLLTYKTYCYEKRNLENGDSTGDISSHRSGYFAWCYKLHVILPSLMKGRVWEELDASCRNLCKGLCFEHELHESNETQFDDRRESQLGLRPYIIYSTEL